MNDQDAPQKRAWYDKKRFVIPLLIFLLPVGLYALYKNREWGKNTKIVVAVVSSLVFIGLGTTDRRSQDNTAENPQNETEEGLAGIWGDPEHACNLMSNAGLETNGYSKIGSGSFICTSSKTVTEMSAATDYRENSMEYGVWGSSRGRIDSITIDLEIGAVNESERVRPLLVTHASGLVQAAFNRDLPEEVESMMRGNETGTWSSEDLRMTVWRMPYRNAEGEQYKLVLQPASQN